MITKLGIKSLNWLEHHLLDLVLNGTPVVRAAAFSFVLGLERAAEDRKTH